MTKPLDMTDFIKLIGKDNLKIHKYQIKLMKEIDKANKENRKVIISIGNGWKERLNRIYNSAILKEKK